MSKDYEQKMQDAAGELLSQLAAGNVEDVQREVDTSAAVGCAVGYRSWRGRFKDRILPGPLRLGASRSALTLRTISGLTCHVSSRLHRRLLSILVMSTMRSLSYFKWGGCNSLVASANGRGSNVPCAVKV